MLGGIGTHVSPRGSNPSQKQMTGKNMGAQLLNPHIRSTLGSFSTEDKPEYFGLLRINPLAVYRLVRTVNHNLVRAVIVFTGHT